MDIMHRCQTMMADRQPSSLALTIAIGVAVVFSTQAIAKKASSQPTQCVASQAAPFVSPTASPPSKPEPKAIESISSFATPITVKVEPTGPFKLAQDAPSWIDKYIVPFLGPLISGALAMLGIGLSYRYTRKNNEQTIWQKANETELKDIITKLDGFYGPFQQMSQANQLLIEEFKSRQAPGFRTLLNVFNQSWLNGLSTGDRQVVAQVCGQAEILEKFIAEKAGMVDSGVVPYLARASAHFRILHLAHEGRLGSDATNFEGYVYPKQLDEVIQLEIERLRKRCDALRENPAEAVQPMAALQIPSNLALPVWPGIKAQAPSSLQAS